MHRIPSQSQTFPLSEQELYTQNNINLMLLTIGIAYDDQ